MGSTTWGRWARLVDPYPGRGKQSRVYWCKLQQTTIGSILAYVVYIVHAMCPIKWYINNVRGINRFLNWRFYCIPDAFLSRYMLLVYFPLLDKIRCLFLPGNDGIK